MHAGGVIEKSAARITGSCSVKISVCALNERDGVGAFSVLKMVNRRERSRRRQLENHPVEIANRPRRRGSVKIPIGARDQHCGVRLIRGRGLENVERRERTILAEL